MDLNRDFPDPLQVEGSSLGGTGREQAETKALMQWTSTTHFVASLSLHEVSKLPPCMAHGADIALTVGAQITAAPDSCCTNLTAWLVVVADSGAAASAPVCNEACCSPRHPML